MPSSTSFGAEFGRIVKTRRVAMGLTQERLAEAALGATNARRRIADIEEGFVANPPPRVIEAISRIVGAEDKTSNPDKSMSLSPPPRAVIEHVLRHVPSPDAADRRAAERLKTAEYHSARIRLSAIGRERATLRPFMLAAQSAVDRASFTEADAMLAEIESMSRRGPVRIEARKERAEIALLACSPERAARHFEAAASYLDPFTPDAASELRNAAANALHRHGKLFGVDGQRMAAELLRKNLSYWRRDRRPEKWAMTQNNLGNALHDIAVRSKGEDATPLLQNAISAYRSALKVYDKARRPKNWGAVQDNLATALSNLARRRRGREAASLFAAAAEAYRNALSVRSQRTTPAEWAATQAHLGLALGAAAQGETRENGARMLDEAAEASNAALGVYDREVTPEHWAVTRNNLGNALRARAAAGGGGALLYKSVAAYRDALTALGQEGAAADPRNAAIRTNLALALTELSAIADPESAAEFSTEAASAARVALKARPRDVALDPWATSLSALIGARCAEAKHLEGDAAAEAASEAAALARQALDLGPEVLGLPRWTQFQVSLGQALEAEAAARPEISAVRRAEARAAYVVALSRMDQHMTPDLAAMANAGRRRVAFGRAF